MPTATTFTSRDFEQDPRWSAVDTYTLSHLQPSTRANTSVLVDALNNSHCKGLRDIASFPAFGKFLALQCSALGVRHALEIGTLGGYACIWLATMNPNLRVTTIELSASSAAVARENLDHAGRDVSDRVEILVGAALDWLPRLDAEICQGKREKFGFVYVDADKPNNWVYTDWAIRLALPRACIIVDNVVQHAKIADPPTDKEKPYVLGARQVIENVGKDDRVDATVIQTVGEKNYDGFLMAVVKP